MAVPRFVETWPFRICSKAHAAFPVDCCASASAPSEAGPDLRKSTRSQLSEPQIRNSSGSGPGHAHASRANMGSGAGRTHLLPSKGWHFNMTLCGTVSPISAFLRTPLAPLPLALLPAADGLQKKNIDSLHLTVHPQAKREVNRQLLTRLPTS